MTAPELRPPKGFKDRAELLDFLLEVASLSASTLDLDQLLARIVALIRSVVPADLVAILLYSERRRGLRLRYAEGYGAHMDREWLIPLEEGLTGLAAQQRMPVVCGDVRNDPRYLPVLDAISSEMAIPMTLRGKLVGVIDIQSTRLNAFSSEDSALVQLIAARVTSSVTNARLFRRLDRQNRTLRMLARVAREFSSSLDLDEVLNKVARTVKMLIQFDAFSIFLVDEPLSVLRSKMSLRYDQRIRIDHIPVGKGISGWVAEHRRPLVVDDTLNDPRYIETSPGIRSEMAIPLLSADHLVGVLDLESERVGYFTEEHLQTLSLLAPLITAALENARLYDEVNRRKRRMEDDLAAAQKLQQTLLPKQDPGIHGLEIGIGFRPAAEISGDVFDFFEQGEDYAIICMGDVAGKSASAALYGAMVTGLLRTLGPRRRTPSALMRTLNEALMERRVGDKYLTLLVLLWQPKTGLLQMAGAGATAPMVLRRGGILTPAVEGFPLGIFPNRDYEEVSFQTEPGDVILLYSDGILDQPNIRDEPYGEGRLTEFAPGLAGLAPQLIVERIFADLDEFRAGRRIHDDQTILAIRVKGPEPESAG